MILRNKQRKRDCDKKIPECFILSKLNQISNNFNRSIKSSTGMFHEMYRAAMARATRVLSEMPLGAKSTPLISAAGNERS